MVSVIVLVNLTSSNIECEASFDSRGSRAFGRSIWTKEVEYGKHAVVALKLVRRASSTADKRRMSALPEVWLDLADRARELAQRSGSPLGSDEARWGTGLSSN
jgi:hypothetical protein